MPVNMPVHHKTLIPLNPTFPKFKDFKFVNLNKKIYIQNPKHKTQIPNLNSFKFVIYI